MSGSILSNGFQFLAEAASDAKPMYGRSRQVVSAEGAWLLSSVADLLLQCGGKGCIHQRAATAWKLSDQNTEVLRKALVLSADHELNASTFAVRVVASTGASLPAALLAGFGALSGPSHGGSTARAAAMFRDALRASNKNDYFAQRLSRGEPLWGYGHPLYPDGDTRARELIAGLSLSSNLSTVLDAAISESGMYPNIDAGLATVALSLDLSDESAFAIFTVGRMAGWIAHAIEQTETGGLIRPRAKYVGSLTE